MSRRWIQVALTLLLVSSLSQPAATGQSDAIPHPDAYFGRTVGAEGVLIPHRRILDYYRLIAERSDRVELETMGETTDGRPFYYAIVTSPDNHARLDELRAINDRLYDPRGLPEAEARELVLEGRTFVIVNEQIHSTEVGVSQGGILLAHRMATGDDWEVERILDQVVLLHVPVHNPDGQEMVYEWLDRWRGTEYENSPPPFLYQKYTGHDNNRDWYMFTQVETRHSIEMQNRWHPQFTLDQHQMGSGGSRIFVPPFEDPWEPNVDPALIASNNMIGTYMGQYLVTAGLAGVEWKSRYDAWTPARAYYHTHGGVRILTEVASADYADDIEIPLGRLPEEFRRQRWNFPMVWEGGTWAFSDVVRYHTTSAMAALRAAADLRPQLLSGMLAAQRRSVEPREGPYAFVFPAGQTDPPTAAKLREVLQIADVEIERATAPFRAGGRQYPAGSHVVRFAQPAGRFAKSVLERQEYPRLFLYEGGPLDPPYDVTAHTLPLLMNVDVVTVERPFTAELVATTTPDPPPGAVARPFTDVAGAGSAPRAYLLDPRVNRSYAAATGLGERGLSRATEPFTAAGRDWPAGTFVVEAPEARAEIVDLQRRMQQLAEEHHLEIVAVPEVPDVPRSWVGAPRVAIYQSYSPSMPEGWFRFVLDQYGIPFDVLHWDDVRRGGLGRYGVIFLPPGGGSACSLVEGLNAECPGGRRGFGGSAVPPDYAGGIGEEGVRALREFVDGGGVLFTWSDSWEFLRDSMGVDASSLTAGLDRTELNIPGSILRTLVDTRNPLGWGLEAETPVFFRNDDVWPADVPGANVIARWPDDEILMSGWIQGAEHLAGNAAMLEIPRGAGRMVMVGFSPEYRAQAYLTYKLLFNAIFYPRSDVQ